MISMISTSGVVVGSFLFLSSVSTGSPVDCGAGTVYDPATSKCVVGGNSSLSSPSSSPTSVTHSGSSLDLSSSSVPNEVRDMIYRMNTNDLSDSFTSSWSACKHKCQRDGASAANWYDGRWGGPRNICNCYSVQCNSDCYQREGCERDNSDWIRRNDGSNKYWVNPRKLKEQLGAACLASRLY